MKFLSRYSHFIFATKVWLASVFLTPFLFIFFDFSPILGSHWLFSEAAGLMVLFGLAYSIPNWLIFTLVVWLIRKQKMPILFAKRFINLVAFLLTILLFYGVLSPLGFSEIITDIPLAPLGYFLTLTFGIWYFKLEPLPHSFGKDALDDSLINVNRIYLEDIVDEDFK